MFLLFLVVESAEAEDLRWEVAVKVPTDEMSYQVIMIKKKLDDLR